MEIEQISNIEDSKNYDSNDIKNSSVPVLKYLTQDLEKGLILLNDTSIKQILIDNAKKATDALKASIKLNSLSSNPTTNTKTTTTITTIKQPNETEIIYFRENLETIYINNKQSFYYYYNCEGVDDYNWGCAWRSSQTQLSNLNANNKLKKLLDEKELNFKTLFYKYGSKEKLTEIFNKLNNQDISSALPEYFNNRNFAPFDNEKHWAEPFISFLIASDMGIPKHDSSLFLINDYPKSSFAPKEVFDEYICSSKEFIYNVRNYFVNNENKYPIVIDDSIRTFCIVGAIVSKGIYTNIIKNNNSGNSYDSDISSIKESKSCSDDYFVKLLIADPHVFIKEQGEEYLLCYKYDDEGKLISHKNEIYCHNIIDFKSGSWMVYMVKN